MTTAYLGLGANKGERIRYLENASREIDNIKSTKIIKSSSIYETEPWGNVEQDDYLNCVVEIQTELTAEELLKELKAIEKKLGRTITSKWAEREIDIDLLFYNKKIIENSLMKVPHSQIENRKFVLIPMKEIAPEFLHPVLKKNISELLKETKDILEVKKYETIKV